jgi:hypothetical protein
LVTEEGEAAVLKLNGTKARALLDAGLQGGTFLCGLLDQDVIDLPPVIKELLPNITNGW